MVTSVGTTQEGGTGYTSPNGYGGAAGGADTIVVGYDPQNPYSLVTVAAPQNIETLPTITVTAPVSSTEPGSFEGWIDDAAGIIAAGLCTYGGGNAVACALVGAGVTDWLKANPDLVNSVHTAGAWSCAKVGDCYEYDEENGIRRTPAR